MTTKLYDICASTGKYTDQNGNTKNRYVNVGAVMDGEYGKFIILNAYFNPAGLPHKEGSTSVILQLFSRKNNNADSYSPAQDYNNPDYYQQDVHEPKAWNPEESSDIPF